ncbi:MAG: glutamine amidotransferase, partial [Ornithinimicrobium sp.]
MSDNGADNDKNTAAASKGEIHLVHLYPREMSIYGDLGNTRCLAARLRWHGYTPVVHDHGPGEPWPERADLILGGGGQDSGQVAVQEDLDVQADRLRDLAVGGTPMLMVCGMYQLFGTSFVTVDQQR